MIPECFPQGGVTLEALWPKYGLHDFTHGMASSKQAGTMAKPSSSTRFLSALMVSASLEITFGISQNKHYASSVAKPGKSGTSSPRER
jgi:hypothetical protein